MKFDDQILHTTNKKTFIYGFAIAYKSFLVIARSIFVNDSINFSYILTYKFSQDHLELLFGQIRQRGGSNNNPNMVQLKTAIKQILIKNAFKSKNNGNCNTFDDDVMCSILDFKWNKKEQFNDNCQTGEADQDILNKLQLINNISPSLQSAKENILYHILGYIIFKIIKKLDCDSCIKSLFKQTSDHNYSSSTYSKFVNLRQSGGLILGFESSFKIIMEAEKILLNLTNNLTTLNIPNLNKKIMFQCSNKLSLNHYIFSKLDCNGSILERPHKMILISLLINRYLSVRLKSFGKHYSALVNTTSKRHKFNKLILFSNH